MDSHIKINEVDLIFSQSLCTVISRNRWPSGTLPRHLSNGVHQAICRWDILSRDWNVIPQHTGILRLSVLLYSLNLNVLPVLLVSPLLSSNGLSNNTSSKPCFTRKGVMDVTFRVTPWQQHITHDSIRFAGIGTKEVQLGAVQVTKLMDCFHKVESGLKGRQLLIRNRVRDGQLPEGTNYCAATCSKMLVVS